MLRLAESRWARAVAPLASFIAKRFAEFFAAAPYPIRSGSHANTAFSCVLALDYARRAGNASLEAEIGGAAKRWYGRDRNAPVAFEPSLDDFLSPSLIEALLMREVLPQGQFRAWLAQFLPAERGPLGEPPVVTDRSDPKQSHLDGLSRSRWGTAPELTRVKPARCSAAETIGIWPKSNASSGRSGSRSWSFPR